ncbi:hypothetical protein DRJ16_01415 [Candidatus Woesearchaeota archaeon]|nr:MAG: hypothetical protein DRJ16_01415 [Candidatus Woesearchaeota archaeon]
MVEIPEFRKLINFGKTSYVISLPKDWIKKNKLSKGDTLVLEECDGGLLVAPKITAKKKKKLETRINIDGKTFEEIRREIISCYIDGYNTLVILGEKLDKLSKKIKKEIISSLMGIEIIEETSNKLILKDFIAPEQIDPIELVRRMDIITREMLIDVRDFIEHPKVSVANIYMRDDEVNRLHYFIQRLIGNYAENNTNRFNPFQLSALSHISNMIERVADEVKRIAKYLNRISSKEELLKSGFKNVYKEFEKFYLKVMKALFLQERNIALKESGKKQELITKSNKLLEKLHHIKWAPSAIEKLKNAILLTNEIGRITSRISFAKIKNDS